MNKTEHGSTRVLPPFALKVIEKLQRFFDCAEDFESGGVDIGRDWLDTLTHLGLLERVQRSPALWQITEDGDALLAAPTPPASEQQRAVVMPERKTMRPFQTVDTGSTNHAAGWNACVAEFLRLNPHLAKGEGV